MAKTQTKRKSTTKTAKPSASKPKTVKRPPAKKPTYPDHLVTGKKTDAERRVTVDHGLQVVQQAGRFDPEPLLPHLRDTLEKDHAAQLANLEQKEN